MAQTRDPRQLAPLADKLLVFFGDLASGADGLSARDEKRLNELIRKARGSAELTHGERLQMVRLMMKAVPEERLDDLKRFARDRGTAKRTRPTLKR